MKNRGHRVVVTGLGIASPIGLGAEALWDGLIAGRCGLRIIGGFDPGGFPGRLGGELPPFTFADYIPKSYRKSAKVMARDIVIAVICAYHAVKDAGLGTRCLSERGEHDAAHLVNSTRFGANIGAGVICADLPELAGALTTAVDDGGKFSLRLWGRSGMENLTPLWLLKFLPNMLACHVTIVHDAQAPSNTITCGEASSHLAIGEAFRTLARGDADVCICGGAESKVNPMGVLRQHRWGYVNTQDNDAPARAVAPFSTRRRGCVPAEGGGLIILETLDHARSRGARIYAELAGFGAAANTTDWRGPDPSGAPFAQAIRSALADAASPEDEGGRTAPSAGTHAVDLVVPSGTGMPAHDAAEMNGWRTALGDQLARAHAAGTRGAVGNSGAGSGAIDFAVAAMAIDRGVVPPTINTEPPDPASPFRFITGGPLDARIRQAVVAGAAMHGGQAAALVLHRFQE
jgi:3-oxoacyl-[acyl-carrier-protein] synthase II